MIATLTRGTDPDRMKGALFVLSSKMLSTSQLMGAVQSADSNFDMISGVASDR